MIYQEVNWAEKNKIVNNAYLCTRRNNNTESASDIIVGILPP